MNAEKVKHELLRNPCCVAHLFTFLKCHSLIGGVLSTRWVVKLFPSGHCDAPLRASPIGNVTHLLPPCGGGEDLRRFTLRQHDPRLPMSGTEEASRNGSGRPVCDVADWLPLSLVNRACLRKLRHSGGAVDPSRLNLAQRSLEIAVVFEGAIFDRTTSHDAPVHEQTRAAHVA